MWYNRVGGDSMKLTEEMLEKMPQNIMPFSEGDIWKRFSKEELIYKFRETDFSEIRIVGDYLDLYIGPDWMYSIGKYNGNFFLRKVGFENEKDMYKMYGAATGMYAGGLHPAGSFAALFMAMEKFFKWLSKFKKKGSH